VEDGAFEYSEKFLSMIKDLHAGKENLPYYSDYIEAHLAGVNSRYRGFLCHLIPEITYRCGDLGKKKVLDFGCGTGATTVALASVAEEVWAYDIDEKSIFICEERVKEHGLLDKVRFVGGSFQEQKENMEGFDFILMNGVIEHIPLSLQGLRKKVLLDLFSLLNAGGYLYINGTPNRLLPFDFHTTRLWWLPWSKPGSNWAYQRAIQKGKHVKEGGHSMGPLGLEERGVWGATYFEIVKYVSGQPYTIMNSIEGYSRHLDYQSVGNSSIKRKAFEKIVYYAATKCFEIPITALTPFLTHLVIRKNDG